jgi:amino acid transporter
MKEADDKALKRDIGFFGSAFLSFNGVVGAGIFALPATLYMQFGDFSPWLFPLFRSLAHPLCLCRLREQRRSSRRDH